MKLPNVSELSKEQREICDAFPEGTSLVYGPPGSGKTIVAMFRENSLRNLGIPTEVVAWNHVLRKYSGMSQTFISWHNYWWKNATGNNFPTIFPDDLRKPDYETACKLAKSTYETILFNQPIWGHLILDEAQDYSNFAHTLLAIIQRFHVNDPQYPSSILILADENQRLSEEYSNLHEICRIHSIESEDIYQLKNNYRNTIQIAKVALEFYQGYLNDLPNLPSRSGRKPRLYNSFTLDDAVNQIVKHTKNYPQNNIGVLVKFEDSRDYLFDQLKRFFGRNKLQMYCHEGGKQMADNLDFEIEGIITVLCYASAKGLEFDSVFLPDLQLLPTNGNQLAVSKQELYVMVTRARSNLYMMFNTHRGETSVWDLFPNDSQRLNYLFKIKN